jgi:hypothetical protein
MSVFVLVVLLVIVTVIALSISLTSVRLPEPLDVRVKDTMATWLTVWTLVMAATYVTYQFVRWLL